ncbi:hypothetical protein [Chitinophaga sp.]|uniref:hypothetical protein n=1 Tax=Chitinophaga sp. TaxID=1869181 RepID=UPI0031D3A29F
MIAQDFDIDTSALRNVYGYFQEFMTSENEVDILKIWVREDGPENVYKRIYSTKMASGDILKYHRSKNGKEELINDGDGVIHLIDTVKTIYPGRYTFFCPNQLTHDVCFYFIKVRGKLVYKLMISDENERLASKENNMLTSLFALFQ